MFLSGLFTAIRPKTLPAAVGPVMVGIALSYHHQGHLHSFIAALTVTVTLLLQIGSNLVNDYFDCRRGVDNHNRLGPLRAGQAKLLTLNQLKVSFIVAFTFALLLAIPLMIKGGWPIITIGIISIITAYCYTGGPFPLSHLALGEVLAIIFFGPVAVAGTYYLQTDTIGQVPILAGMIPGFLAAAIMAINNLRDIESDTQSNKTTLATLLGRKRAGQMVLVLLWPPSLIGALLAWQLSAPLLLSTLPLPLLLWRDYTDILYAPLSSRLNLTLARTGQLLFFNSLLISGGVLW